MDSSPLVADQISAGAEFIGRLSKTLPLKGAFWARLSDKGKWLLYVVYDPPEGKGVREGYDEVNRVETAMQNPWLGPFKVKLINSKDRQAAELLDLYRRYPGTTPARYDDEMLFGTRFVDGLYMYPPPAEMAVS